MRGEFDTYGWLSKDDGRGSLLILHSDWFIDTVEDQVVPVVLKLIEVKRRLVRSFNPRRRRIAELGRKTRRTSRALSRLSCPYG